MWKSHSILSFLCLFLLLVRAQGSSGPFPLSRALVTPVSSSIIDREIKFVESQLEQATERLRDLKEFKGQDASQSIK